MAQDETTVLAQLSNCRAALDRVLLGVASAGDYTIGGKKVERSRLIDALTNRERGLVGQLDDVPGIAITTMDGEAVSDLGVVDIEYVGDNE